MGSLAELFNVKEDAPTKAPTPAPTGVSVEVAPTPMPQGSLAEMYGIKEEVEAPKAKEDKEDKEYSLLAHTSNVAGAINKAIVDTVSLPLTLAGMAAEGTAEVSKFLGLTDYGAEGVETHSAYDIPVVGDFLKEATARTIPEGENTAADAARTFAEWGALGPVSAARGLGTKTLKGLTPTTTQAVKKASDDILMGTGAATGELLFDDAGEVGGEIGGGVVGLAAALRGKAPLDWILNKAPSSLTGRAPLPTRAEKLDAKHEQGALDLIIGNLGDEAAAKISLQDSIKAGRKGTTLDALNDQGVNVVERVVQKQAQGQNAVTKALRAQEADAVNALSAGTFGATPSMGAQSATDQALTAQRAAIEQQMAADLAVEGQRIDAAANETLVGKNRDIQALADAQEAEALQNALRGKRVNEETTGAGLNELVDIDAATFANEKALQEAIDAQEALVSQTAGTRPTAEASETAVSALKQGKETARETKEAPLWKAFDEGEGFSAQQLQGAIKESVSGLPPEAIAGVEKKYPTFFKDIEKMDWETTVSPESVSYVISQVKSDLKAKGKEHWGTNEKNLAETIKKVEAEVSSLNPAYGAAKDMTREILQQYGPSKVAGAGRGTDEEFMSKLMGGSADSQTAAVRQLKSTKEPEAIKAGEDWLRRQNKHKTIDQKFLDENEGVLAEYPALRKEYEALATSGEAVKAQKGLTKATNRQLEKEATKLERQQIRLDKEGESIFPKAKQAALDAQNKAAKAKQAAVEKSGVQATAAKESALTKSIAAGKAQKGLIDTTLAGKYVNDPIPTIQKALTDTSRTSGDLGTLYKNLKAQGQGEAFKGSVRDAIMDKFTTKASGRNVPETVAGVADSVHKMRPQLVDNGILTATEFDEMAAIIDYQAKGKGLRKHTTDLDTGMPVETRNLESSMIAAAINKAMPIGQGLVMTGAIKRYVSAKMTESMLSNPATRKHLSDFMADPKKFADRWDDISAQRYKSAKTPEAKSEIILKLLTSRPAVVGTSNTDDQE